MDRRALLRTTGLTLTGLVAGCSEPGTSNPAPDGSTRPTPARPSPSRPAPTTPPTTHSLAISGEITHGPRDRPLVALTFHGQGTPTQVVALLTQLEAKNARGSVLAVGSWLQSVPAIATRIVDKGHDLGNHTQNHIDIAHSDRATAYAEIEKCAAELRRLTGSIGTWFRPSQTQHSTSVIRAEAEKVGYQACLSYDVDSLDFTNPGVDAVVRNTLGSVGKGSIVSMHCGHDDTIRALPRILQGLADRGLRAVSMTELMS